MMTGMDAGGAPRPEGSSGPQKGPIFVVGSMRSGSTLLRLILDSHPQIAIGAETGFVGAALANKSIPNWRYGKDWYRRLDWSEAEFDERLREFYGGMFERFAASQGKPRWGEKTPFHTAHMTAMSAIFPDAVFVGIVRHPGAVAASLRQNFHYTFPEALSYWAAVNLDLARGAAALGDRFVGCRYEDLVGEAEPVLRELMTFLGEPWSQDLLEHHLVQRDKGAPRAVDGATITRRPIDTSGATRWSDAATADDLAALRSAAGLAGFFGYDVNDAFGIAPLAAPGGPTTRTFDGAALAARRAAWADRVDFDARPPAPAIDASPQELAQRLAQVERALARTRSRRSVRLSDAVRRVQHGRSREALRQAWALLRTPPP